MQPPSKPIVFYDGSCGLCHGFVRWVWAHDPAGIFQFAPLQGATFAQHFLPADKEGLPDSVIIRSDTGEIFVRSSAVVYVLRRLGKGRLASMVEVFPRGLRDVIYGFIARIRYAVFGRKQELCPILPVEARGRFLD